MLWNGVGFMALSTIIRRSIRSCGLAISALIALSWGLTSHWHSMVYTVPIGTTGCVRLVLDGIGICIEHYPTNPYSIPLKKGLELFEPPDLFGLGYGWVCEIGSGIRGCWQVGVPFWFAFLLFAVPLTILWLRSRRIPPGYCQACGYNLTGNVSGVCPECGSPVDEPEGTHPV